MIGSSYQHPVLGMYRMDKIEKAVRESLRMGYLHYSEDAPNVYIVTKHESSHIDQFTHPLLLDHVAIVDGRTFTQVDRTGEFKGVSDRSEYEFSMLRANLDLVWSNPDDQLSILALSKIPCRIYASWVSEAISRSLYLDPGKQADLYIIAAFYFWCQLRPPMDSETFKNNMPKILQFISVSLAVSIESITMTLDDVPELEFIETEHNFIQTLNRMGLDQFNLLGLRTLLSSSWRGGQAREVALLGISYPPALLAMVYVASHDRRYRQTPIQKIIDRSRNLDMDNYRRQVKSILPK